MAEDKENRKALLKDLRLKAKEEFETSLPMTKENFKKMFNYIDVQLGKKGCTHTNSLVKESLNQLEIKNTEDVLTWLSNKGGYCDCEILANVEALFD